MKCQKIVKNAQVHIFRILKQFTIMENWKNY